MCLAIRDVPMVGLMAGVVQKRRKGAWGEAAQRPPPPLGQASTLVRVLRVVRSSLPKSPVLARRGAAPLHRSTADALLVGAPGVDARSRA